MTKRTRKSKARKLAGGAGKAGKVKAGSRKGLRRLRVALNATESVTEEILKKQVWEEYLTRTCWSRTRASRGRDRH
jgi:hypothetical protein